MTRLVLALLIVAALVAGAAVLALGLRAAFADGAGRQRETDSTMQKIAFSLLVALIFYVAFQGAA